MVYILRELRNLVLKFRNVLKISSATAEDKLDPVYREAEHERINDNFLRIIPSSIALLVVEICGILYNVISGSSLSYKIVYIIAFIVFFINTLIVLGYINKVIPQSNITDKKKDTISYLYWLIYTFSAMSFSVFEMLDLGTTNLFFVFVFSISLWSVFEPLLSIPYYVIPLAVETYFIYKTGGQYLDYMFCYIISAGGIISSFIKYSKHMTQSISNKRLERMAEVDPLTGLMNRRGMQRSVEGIWEYCRTHSIPVTVAILDIDFFKMYNDKYGHSKGDECLKRISTCIKSCFSRRTDITCRYGGEEFVIILAGESEQQSIISLTNLQNKIKELQIASGNQEFNDNVTVSIGVCSSLVDENITLKDLILSADNELYFAKENGRKCLSFRGELYNK